MRRIPAPGRVPTEKGLRLFVDGLLEIGELAPDERVAIEARMAGSGSGVEDVLTQATTLLSGLSRCAGLVVAAKQDSALKHVEFVSVAPGKALVVMVSEDGQVENRLIDTPIGLPASALIEASNYLNARLRGRTLDAARARNPGRARKRTRRARRADRQDRRRRSGDLGRRTPTAKRKC